MKLPTISLFSKITFVIIVFAVLTYFLSTRLTSLQYKAQDAIYDIQNLGLYQKMVQSWVYAIPIDTLKIKNDLESLTLVAYIAEYKDLNENLSLDLQFSDTMYFDPIIWSWDTFDEQINFDFNQYQSYADLISLHDRLQESDSSFINTDNLKYWTSYGNYGINNIPATFVEIVLESGNIIGCYLILDHPLPADIDWPSRIVPLLILIMLLVLFGIIKKFLYPITVIINRIRKVKTGDLDSTIPILSNDELSELSQTTNNFIYEIKNLIMQKHNLILDVSHELKSPLTRLRFLLEDLPHSNNKMKMNKEINFLKGMITNMLLSDKLSTPYVENLTKSNMTVESLISGVLDMFHNIDEKLIINNLCPELIIEVDKYKLMLAIRNLVDNALKYGASKKKIDLSILHEKNKLTIAVRDWGVGISQEQLTKIQTPFFRGTASQESHKSGFGLGLSIAQKIIKAHQGQLTIESEIDKGSCFTIILSGGRI